MEKKNIKFGFIGVGKMGTAILKGMITSSFIQKENVYIFDKNTDLANKVQEELEVNLAKDLQSLLKETNIILVATKPFVSDEVLNSIKDYIDNHLVISIMAGVSISKIENILSGARVIRVMPNTPALVNQGMSAVCKGTLTTDDDIYFALELFSKLGKAIKIDEKYIDIVTGISGSGPAFFYYFIEEIARGGEKLGLDYETCLKLSAQTALGSAVMVMNSEDNPSTLIKNVTTPGGCTEAGNNVLAAYKTDEILHKVVDETMKKAKSLG